MKQKLATSILQVEAKKKFPACWVGVKKLLMYIILWVEIIDTMSGIVKPPSSMEFIKAARFTLSLPFQMKE